MIPPSVKARWERDLLPVEMVKARIDGLLRDYCDRRNFPFSSRKKTLESLAEKIETGRFARWSELDDLVACSVIVPNLLEEPKVLEDLGKLVEVVQVKKRGSTKKAPDAFRFDSTRLICRLRPSVLDEPTSPIFRLLFEVQVRTAFEYAWATATHPLVYKGQQNDWRKLRLAAQLKASVEQMDIMILGFDSLVEHVPSSDWPELSARLELESFLKSQIATGAIPSESTPKDWTRLTQNLFDLLTASERSRDTRAIDMVPKVVSALQQELSEAAGAKFPRSISLFQFCMGALVQRSTIKDRFVRYHALVTDELRNVYDATSSIEATFDLES